MPLSTYFLLLLLVAVVVYYRIEIKRAEMRGFDECRRLVDHVNKETV